MISEKVVLSRIARRRTLLVILSLGLVLFIWELGSTGLFDETPPLFAAAGRAMHLSGDWLTPRVNGLPRFDKPPFVYWLMSLIYGLPGQDVWDPLGTWSARLPSAFASLVLMIFIGKTLLDFPQGNYNLPRRTAVIASLAFALSPLVIIWSRIAVSDALLCSTLGISLLLQWRRYSDPDNESWYWPWIVLALAVLTKGPVAIFLSGMTLVFFGISEGNLRLLISRIRLIRGLFITAIISLPWYLMELLIEGKPFWDSFFGYHNFQRLLSVVNSHQQPWWFFGLILIISSLPFTPFLFLSIYKEFIRLINIKDKSFQLPSESLNRFAFCWLISILLFFTTAATKLPSYWLPATPAAAILIAICAQNSEKKNPFNSLAWIISCLISLGLAISFYASSNWIYLINDPEMPDLAEEFLSSGIYKNAFFVIAIGTFLAILCSSKFRKGRLILLQIPFIFVHLFVVLPIWELGDRLRQFPLRQASELILDSQRENEFIAMVGINKPSIHFYTNKIIIYESNDVVALVNLSERLRMEKRRGWEGKKIDPSFSTESILLVIDDQTSQYSHWKDLNPEVLGQFSIYNVWRLSRVTLENRAKKLSREGVTSNWQLPRAERL